MDQVALASVTVADELNIFQFIGQSGKNLETIASEIKADKRSAEVILNTLVASGLLDLKMATII